MLHRLFTLLSALSLLLCVATAVFWVRSYRSGDRLPVRFAGQPWRLVSERGRMVLDNQPEVQRAGDDRRAWVAASLGNADAITRYVANTNGRQRATTVGPPRITQLPDTPPDVPAYLRQPLVPWALLTAMTAVFPVALGGRGVAPLGLAEKAAAPRVHRLRLRPARHPRPLPRVRLIDNP